MGLWVFYRLDCAACLLTGLSEKCEQPLAPLSVLSAPFSFFFLSLLLWLLCLGLRIAYRLFMTAKSKKSHWARTVIIVENGAQ